IISVLLYIVIWFAAPLIADFFNQQQLIVIVRLMGLDIIFMGLIIVQRAVLLQSLNFKKLSYIEITSEILSGLIGIYLAFTGHGVISLAIKFFLRSFFTSAFLWITNPWKPIGFIKKDSFNSLFKFGSNLMFTSFLNSGFNNLFDVIIGKFYSPALLGFYNR